MVSRSADDASPSTPLTAGARVHAYVKIAAGTSSGNPIEDTLTVRSESEGGDQGHTVSSYDGNGRKLGSATVDGCVDESKAVSAMEGELLGPLVDQVATDFKLNQSALLCYGEEGSGREEALLGSDALVMASANRILANAPPGSALNLSATLIAMELLIDLFSPEANVTINETQFSGLHLDGGEWKKLGSAAEVSPLLAQINQSRADVMSKMDLGLSARSVLIIGLRLAPASTPASLPPPTSPGHPDPAVASNPQGHGTLSSQRPTRGPYPWSLPVVPTRGPYP